MKIIVIPDSFKGTMTAIEVCDTITAALREKKPELEVRAIPMADGGEGTCEAFAYALGGQLVNVQVHDPYMQLKSAVYWRDESTAVVELAQAAGFIAARGRGNPAVTTTFGVGEMIRHAINSGCRRIILGLGGSCTNDAGIGMTAALGAVFTDAEKRTFLPTGNSIHRIRGIDLSGLNGLIQGVQIQVMCDVNNPLYGEQGAAYVFGPQKGADAAMVQELDHNLRFFAGLVKDKLGIDVSSLPGGGAAGGAGAGAFALLGAGLRKGAEIVLEMNRFDELAAAADLVITGEGQLDEQSLRGKVVLTVADHARALHLPVIAIVGRTDGDIAPVYGHGIKKVIRTIDYCQDPDHYEISCRQDLYAAASACISSFRSV